MNKALNIAGVALAIAAVGTAYAEQTSQQQTHSLYAGADLGFMEVDSNASADQLVLFGRLGIPLNETVSVEGILGLGLDGESVGSVDVETESVLGIAALAKLPISAHTDLYGSLGLYRIAIELDGRFTNRDEDDTDLGVQFGVKHRLQDGIVLHGGYFLGDIEDADYDGLQLGIQFPLNI